jgi:1,4-dihydroxy-2-naphthoate polyprenyltransferase
MEKTAFTLVPVGSLQRLGVFFELGKLKIVELWLGFFVGLSLLGLDTLTDARALPILALTLVSSIAVIAATCSLDDITGVRDGVDQANHKNNPRWGVSKPILDGRLTEQRAFKFVYVLGAIAALGYAGVIAVAWPLPAWLIVTMTGVILLSLNYSYGLKLSYRGAGELVYFVACAGTVLIPYGLIEGRLTWAVLINAALVGSWHVQVMVFSNTKDAEGDRATGRMTIAARTSKRGNYAYISSVFLLFWAVTAAALASGVVPAWYAVALGPVWALQIYQLWSGVRHEQWLRARFVGFRIVRLGTAALTIVNLIVHR